MPSRWTLDVVTPPFAQDVALDLAPIAGKSNASLLWRKLRPALALRWHGQAGLRREAIDKSAKRILWIYKGSPQVGDSLMDLASRLLLRDALGANGIEIDLYTDPHLHRLYEADDVFARVASDAATLAGRGYDLAIVDSYKWRCIESKVRHWKNLPFVTMRGHFVGPEFNRTLFGFFRMQQLLGMAADASATRRIASPHLAAPQAVSRQVDAIGIPHGAIAFAVGGADEARTWRQWDALLEELVRRGHAPAAVLLGSGNGASMRDVIVARARERGWQVIDCVDRYSLLQAFEIMKRCSLAVAADGGLLHVAHAAGLPTVALFDRHIRPALRLTDANRTIALQSRGATNDIPVADVAAAIETAWRRFVEEEVRGSR
jgi:heptosyltransferase-2